MIAIDLPLGTISPRPSSHKAAWAYLWALQLKQFLDRDTKVLHGESWSEFSRLGMYHGMEFSGSLNMFGGANAEHAGMLSRLLTIDPMKTFSIDVPMPDYGELAKGRLNACSEEWREVGWDLVSERCKSVTRTLTQGDLSLKFDRVVLGDSHSISAYRSGSFVLRNDGQTLHGALKKTLKSFIDPVKKYPKHGTFYFGNIDIRHHLMRQSDPKTSIDALHTEYIKQINGLNLVTSEIVSALPIENESRRLPKTGFYKNTPFYGSWQERTELVKYWNASLKARCAAEGIEFYEHPECYFNSIGELTFDVMEKPQSVHIARSHYRWDLIQDAPNSFAPIEVPKAKKIKKEDESTDLSQFM